MIYVIPELGPERFADLAAAGKQVDLLVEQTGSVEYCVVYEWADDAALDDEENVPPPDAMLTRVEQRWLRRQVEATLLPSGEYSMGFGDAVELDA